MRMLEIAVALGLTLAATPAFAQANAVDRQFEKANSVLLGKKYTPTGWEMRGTSAKGAEASFPLPLRGAREFTLVAACDENCDNVDLFLIGSDGKVVAEDIEDDDLPIVQTEATGDYTVRVRMTNCATATCGFGIKAYKR